jgi:hypothetical protein
MDGTLVSVLVPTRNRVEMLEKSLRSLIDTADLKLGRQYEIILRHDDKATQRWLESHPDLWTTFVHGPRGNGYADLHIMYNEMCLLARGRFLFLWNDDAVMVTPGWDLEIARHDDDKPCYLRSKVEDGRGRDAHLFPIVHRSWYDVCGHFSMSPHNDTYLFSAFNTQPQLFRDTDIVVKHNALQNLNDLTSLEAQRWWPTTKAGWDSAEVQNALAEDIKRLGELVKQHS